MSMGGGRDQESSHGTDLYIHTLLHWYDDVLYIPHSDRSTFIVYICTNEI